MDQNNSKRSGMDLGHTQYFKVQPDQESGVKKILSVVYEALSEKGYDPVNQIVGYIMSGDPTYITNYRSDLHHQLHGSEKPHHEGGER